MENLLNIYNHLKAELKENSQAEAFRILEHTLDIKREDLILNKDRKITPDDERTILKILDQRLGGRPLTKILGEKEFWGLTFKTTTDTLDPRADSETLIRTALSFFPDKTAPLKILDLGTGTGCLIISLLYEYGNATGKAVDISNKAADIARQNADALKVAGRLSIECLGWNDLDVIEKYDLIVSNPPYISYEEEALLDHEVTKHDPHSALFAGENGLAAYQQLAQIIPHMLKNQESIAVLEIGNTQADDVTEIFRSVGMIKKHLAQDLAGRDRCLVFGKKE